jgi:hypothetical protein
MLLTRRWSGRDATALRYAVRALVPLVQVPPRGVWGTGGLAASTSVEAWLRRPLARKPSPDRMVLRYLGAFGPASVRDVQAWSGLTRLREVTDRIRPQLRVFKDSDGQELFDLPGAPRPRADTPAPARFLPEYDNVLLAHADRSRILAARHRNRLFATGGLLFGTFLLDGFVAGRWRMTRARGTATLEIQPFEPLTRRDREALDDEGNRLLSFAAADSDTHAVRYIED